MRISDWSSDVCSSDLGGRRRQGPGDDGARRQGPAGADRDPAGHAADAAAAGPVAVACPGTGDRGAAVDRVQPYRRPRLGRRPRRGEAAPGTGVPPAAVRGDDPRRGPSGGVRLAAAPGRRRRNWYALIRAGIEPIATPATMADDPDGAP